MTKKLSELRDELARNYSKHAESPGLVRCYYLKGFDAAIAELWPVIESLLKSSDVFALTSHLAQVTSDFDRQKLGIEGKK